MVNPVKPYIIDTGLVGSFALSRDQDLGYLLENCIFLELCRRYAKVAYMMAPSGFEVDFFVEYPDGTRQAIQVSADVSYPTTRDRECRVLIEASAIVPDADSLLINRSEETTIEMNNATIHFVPAWKWLLDNM